MNSIHIDVAEHNSAITPEEASDALRLFEVYPEIGYVALEKSYADWPGLKTPHLNSFDLYSPFFHNLFGSPIYDDDQIMVFEVGDGGSTQADAK